MRKSLVWWGFAAAILALPACSSSSSSNPTGPGDSGPADTSVADTAPNPNNCVQPGATGNEKGIGAYCTVGGNDCPSVDGGILVCSGDFGAPPNYVFCSSPCNTTAECGTGALCIMNPLGTGCAPIQCIPPDAGVQPDAGPGDAGGGDAPAGDASGD